MVSGSIQPLPLASNEARVLLHGPVGPGTCQVVNLFSFRFATNAGIQDEFSDMLLGSARSGVIDCVTVFCFAVEKSSVRRLSFSVPVHSNPRTRLGRGHFTGILAGKTFCD